MKIINIILGAFCAFFTVGNAVHGQAEMYAKVKISAIKSFVLEDYDPDNAQPNVSIVADLTVIFGNDSDHEITMRDGQFNLMIKEPEKEAVFIGRGKIDQVVLPSKKQTTKKLRIDLGYKGNETISRLMAVLNFIGNPATVKTLLLNGVCDFGLALPNGKIFDQNKGFELEYKPKFQDEIILQ